jgi:hypothetical protein
VKKSRAEALRSLLVAALHSSGVAFEEAAFFTPLGGGQKLRNLARQTHFAGYANLSELAQAFTLIDANSAD